ncbi:hypothetical protein QQ045_024134 [Rhodiola kirilowii]
MEVSEAVFKVKALVKEISNSVYNFVMSRSESVKVWCPRSQDKNSAGLVEFARTNITTGLSSVVEVEGTAVHLGMIEADKHGISKAIFATDNVEVLQMLQQGCKNKVIERIWYKECRNMLQGHDEWRMAHVFREANSVADFLAKKATTTGWNWL